jgi:salicylate hydroxylase
MGGEILFNHELLKPDVENLKLHFCNNNSYKVRHIVACDGIKSICRHSIESQTDPVYSGYSVWRAIINKKQENIRTYLGSNHHIVTYPISASQISFVAAIKTDKKYKESWRIAGTLNELKEDLALSDTNHFSFITEKTPLFKWGVYIRPMIKNIQYKNLTLLGDAAHPIVPFIGQGGCLAMEDAFIFGNLIIKCNSDISSAQSSYEKLRMKRIKMISKLSLRQGYLNHLSNPLVVLIRNLVMKYFSFLAMRSIKSNVWDYDPQKDI